MVYHAFHTFVYIMKWNSHTNNQQSNNFLWRNLYCDTSRIIEELSWVNTFRRTAPKLTLLTGLAFGLFFYYQMKIMTDIQFLHVLCLMIRLLLSSCTIIIDQMSHLCSLFWCNAQSVCTTPGEHSLDWKGISTSLTEIPWGKVRPTQLGNTQWIHCTDWPQNMDVKCKTCTEPKSIWKILSIPAASCKGQISGFLVWFCFLKDIAFCG